MAGRVAAVRQLPAQLADRAEALGENVVVVDRLEVDLAGEHEVVVAELVVGFKRALDHEPHRVLDEAGREVRVFDDEELVRALEELVDRRAHRALDQLDEVLRVEPQVGAEVERPAATLVVGGERDELEDPLDVRVLEAGLAEPFGRLVADKALCARAGVDAGGLDADDPPRAARDAAARPTSVTSSCVRSPVTGVVRSIG